MAWDPDLGDEPPSGWRDRAPDRLAPIDPDAPVSGHHPPAPRGSVAAAPEQDWQTAAPIIMPVLRPESTSGTRLSELDPVQLASEGLKTHATPVVDAGPCGLPVGYLLRAGGFDVLVNADHLLAWGVPPDTLRAAAMANLAAWSATAPWTDEVSGHRRLISSATGDGGDAARVLLPDVRAYLVGELGSGARVLVGLPERDLLVAAALYAGDDEFAILFAEFVATQAAGADQPLDRRVHEMVGGELRPFQP
ncbi:MAG: hypothetical protein HW391_547 [Chloroflexi bacterium]|nr:hypothetical protein [Chloroflexota bacterium]